jgi:hypothetical protein
MESVACVLCGCGLSVLLRLGLLESHNYGWMADLGSRRSSEFGNSIAYYFWAAAFGIRHCTIRLFIAMPEWLRYCYLQSDCHIPFESLLSAKSSVIFCPLIRAAPKLAAL